MRMNKNRKGFTLVELLVVIAIIGLLATIAFIALSQARVKARDAKRISDIREMQSALELYYNDQITPGYPQVSSSTVLGSSILNTTYVATVPTAPTPADTSTCTATTCGGGPGTTCNSYIYDAYVDSQGTQCTAGSACGWYKMSFCLGAPTGGLRGGVRSTSPSGMN